MATRHREPMDWVRAGLDCLAAGGVEAVRVEPLAKALGVTKGSFYWHFADRPALLAAILKQWESIGTTTIMEEVEARGGTAEARLLQLFLRVGEVDGRLELAIRAWASTDNKTARVLARVDRRRLGYLETLLRGAGLPAPVARARSRLAYHAVIGGFLVRRKGAGEPHRAAIRANHAMLLRWP